MEMCPSMPSKVKVPETQLQTTNKQFNGEAQGAFGHGAGAKESAISVSSAASRKKGR